MRLGDIEVNMSHVIAYLLGMGSGYFVVNWGKRKLEEYLEKSEERLSERIVRKLREPERDVYSILEEYGRTLDMINKRLEALERYKRNEGR